MSEFGLSIGAAQEGGTLRLRAKKSLVEGWLYPCRPGRIYIAAPSRFWVSNMIIRPCGVLATNTTGYPRRRRSLVVGHALFMAESFSGWHGDGVAGGQQAGEECAESEERGGCEQSACGKGALHPVGEDGAEKAVKRKTDDNARGRADERDARGDPQDVRARRAERQADAELRSALRDGVSDDAEDAGQRERERHGGEDAKQYGEEPLAAVLCVALDGFVEGEGAVESRC